MNAHQRAVVFGASSGIGYGLARCSVRHGFDLLIAADEPNIHRAAQELRGMNAEVETVEADLATEAGVDALWGAIAGRRVAALLANAGRGLEGVPRAGLRSGPARHRHQHHRHVSPDPARRPRHGRSAVYEADLRAGRGIVLPPTAHLRVQHVGAGEEPGVGRARHQTRDGDARIRDLVVQGVGERNDEGLRAVATR
jgi:NAD(P)-dependent dehydrogenase (short-subunit alcohol dehydrogenase family)